MGLALRKAAVCTTIRVGIVWAIPAVRQSALAATPVVVIITRIITPPTHVDTLLGVVSHAEIAYTWGDKVPVPSCFHVTVFMSTECPDPALIVCGIGDIHNG